MAAALGSGITAAAAGPQYNVFVGFFSSDPVEIYSFDRGTGSLARQSTVAAGASTAWMTPSTDLRTLYVANHADAGSGVTVMGLTGMGDGTISASVSSFASMAPVANPVSMALFPAGPGRGTRDVLFTSSYEEGTMSSFLVWDDGTLMPASSSIAQGPNAHQVVIAPRTGGFALLVPSLGSDSIVLNAIGGETNPSCPLPGSVCVASTAQSRPGSGPRHLVFHPSIPTVAYVINEKDSSVAKWTYDPAAVTLSNPVYVSALPPGVQPNASLWAAGEIAVSNDGSVLYASNRALSASAGTSSIAAFRLAANGDIGAPIGWYDGAGDVNFPRHFSLTPDGQWMLVANQRGQSVTIFHVERDGSLTKVGTTQTLGKNPVFVFALPGIVPNPNPASGAKKQQRLALCAVTAAVAATAALASSRGGAGVSMLSVIVGAAAAITAGIAGFTG